MMVLMEGIEKQLGEPMDIIKVLNKRDSIELDREIEVPQKEVAKETVMKVEQTPKREQSPIKEISPIKVVNP